MGRIEDHSFNVTFVLTGSKYSELNPTKQDLKSVGEKLGIKVTLPNSHGDPILMEYGDVPFKPVPPVVTPPIQKKVIPPTVRPIPPRPVTPSLIKK